MTSKAAASARDPIASLYGELRGALLAYLRKHTGDAQAAEDLLHDVVVKALVAGRNAERTPENLTGWLYTVAHNAAIDYHRRQRPSEELPEDLADTRDERDAAQELANCLRPLVERLPPIYRETLLAAEFEGRPLRALAEAEGVSLSAIKSRASRGRRLLQDELAACCSVTVSKAGKVLDYDERAAGACAGLTGRRCNTPSG